MRRIAQSRSVSASADALGSDDSPYASFALIALTPGPFSSYRYVRDWRSAWRADPLKIAVAPLLPSYLV